MNNPVDCFEGLHKDCAKIISAKHIGSDQEQALLQYLEAGRSLPERSQGGDHMRMFLKLQFSILFCEHFLCHAVIEHAVIHTCIHYRQHIDFVHHLKDLCFCLSMGWLVFYVLWFVDLRIKQFVKY